MARRRNLSKSPLDNCDMRLNSVSTTDGGGTATAAVAIVLMSATLVATVVVPLLLLPMMLSMLNLALVVRCPCCRPWSGTDVADGNVDDSDDEGDEDVAGDIIAGGVQEEPSGEAIWATGLTTAEAVTTAAAFA